MMRTFLKSVPGDAEGGMSDAERSNTARLCTLCPGSDRDLSSIVGRAFAFSGALLDGSTGDPDWPEEASETVKP